MTDIRGDGAKGRSRRGLAAYALWGAAAIGLAVVVYVIVALVFKPGGDLKSLAQGTMSKLEVTANGQPPPAQAILAPDGSTTDLTKLKAPVVVVNLWATWCGPCVIEMPTLAKLQAAYAGKVLVVPVSMDAAKDRDKAKAFIGEHAPLALYQDPTSSLVFKMTPPVDNLPTTLIYDRTGHERARLEGGADWSSPQAHAVIDALLAGK